MKRQPHVLAAQIVLAIEKHSCDPYGPDIARHLGKHVNTVNKILSELVSAGVLARIKEEASASPPRWRYRSR